jgi:hypothetical protein
MPLPYCDWQIQDAGVHHLSDDAELDFHRANLFQAGTHVPSGGATLVQFPSVPADVQEPGSSDPAFSSALVKSSLRQLNNTKVKRVKPLSVVASTSPIVPAVRLEFWRDPQPRCAAWSGLTLALLASLLCLHAVSPNVHAVPPQSFYVQLLTLACAHGPP